MRLPSPPHSTGYNQHSKSFGPNPTWARQIVQFTPPLPASTGRNLSR
jgi:hypothetical protein